MKAGYLLLVPVLIILGCGNDVHDPITASGEPDYGSQTPPYFHVVKTDPPAGSAGVGVKKNILITFSSDVGGGNFRLQRADGQVVETVSSLNGIFAEIIHTQDLSPGTSYMVRIDGARPKYGSDTAVDHYFSFST